MDAADPEESSNERKQIERRERGREKEEGEEDEREGERADTHPQAGAVTVTHRAICSD